MEHDKEDKDAARINIDSRIKEKLEVQLGRDQYGEPKVDISLSPEASASTTDPSSQPSPGFYWAKLIEHQKWEPAEVDGGYVFFCGDDNAYELKWCSIGAPIAR